MSMPTERAARSRMRRLLSSPRRAPAPAERASAYRWYSAGRGPWKIMPASPSRPSPRHNVGPGCPDGGWRQEPGPRSVLALLVLLDSALIGDRAHCGADADDRATECAAKAD